MKGNGILRQAIESMEYVKSQRISASKGSHMTGGIIQVDGGMEMVRRRRWH